MKNSILGLGFIFLSFLITSDLNAQNNRNSENETRSSFEQNFWYGGNLAIQFSSFYSLAALEPMLGYKLDKNGTFSIGPRVSLEYTSQNYRVGLSRVNSLNFGLGIFSRAKIYKGVFAHVEYEKLNFKEAEINSFGNIVVVDNEIQTERKWRNNYFLGGGFKQGTGRVGFEIALLFNISNELRLDEDPLEYRVGFNVNF